MLKQIDNPHKKTPNYTPLSNSHLFLEYLIKIPKRGECLFPKK